MTMTNEEYEAFNEKVRECGHLAGLSRFIDFLSFGGKTDNWMDIKWGGSSLRLEIRENEIRMIYTSEIGATKDAINSLTVHRAKNWDAEKKQWIPIQTDTPKEGA